MLNKLNKYGLPTKYAIIGVFGGIISVFLTNLIGISDSSLNYVSTPIATGIGGAIGGWIRQRNCKNK